MKPVEAPAAARIADRVTGFPYRALPAPRDGGFAMDDYWVWCGSATRGEDGRYHLFASRWPRDLPFWAGYTYYSQIVRAVADRPEGPYSFEEVVLPRRNRRYWDGQMTHNPTIHRFGDRYVLFYVGATCDHAPPDGDALRADRELGGLIWRRQCIGVATAPSIEGPWERPDHPILTPDPEGWDRLMVSNPAPVLAPDGGVLLIYRASILGQPLRLGAARATHAAGPYTRMLDEPIRFDRSEAVMEDPFIWHEDGRYQMIAKDMTGAVTGERHAGVHATSSDGISWRISDRPRAYSRRVTWDRGPATVQGCLERPQLLFENGVATHMFAATGDGPGGFDHCTRTWTAAIPLQREPHRP